MKLPVVFGHNRSVNSNRPPAVDPKYSVERIGQKQVLRTTSIPDDTSRLSQNSPDPKPEGRPHIVAFCSSKKIPFGMIVEPNDDKSVTIVEGVVLASTSNASGFGTTVRKLDFVGRLQFRSSYQCPHCRNGSIVKCAACDRFSCNLSNNPTFACQNCSRSGRIHTSSKLHADVVRDGVEPHSNDRSAPQQSDSLVIINTGYALKR